MNTSPITTYDLCSCGSCIVHHADGKKTGFKDDEDLLEHFPSGLPRNILHPDGVYLGCYFCKNS